MAATPSLNPKSISPFLTVPPSSIQITHLAFSTNPGHNNPRSSFRSSQMLRRRTHPWLDPFNQGNVPEMEYGQIFRDGKQEEDLRLPDNPDDTYGFLKFPAGYAVEVASLPLKIRDMPTVIVVQFDGKWEVTEGLVYKWNPRANAKFVAIPVDDDICYFENLKSEIYRAGKVEDTANLRLSYLLESPCNIQPIYIENDHDLKAYLYLGYTRSRPVLQVEIECVASVDSFDNVHGYGIDENNCNINEQMHFDDYFHLNIVSVDRNNSSDFIDEVHNLDAMHVDRSNTDELYDEACNDAIEVEANLVQSNDANFDADVDIDSDTFSFTDGSNLFVGQEFPNREAVKKELIRISLETCFEFETVKSSQKVYAVKCVVSDCKWRIWTSLIKNDSRAFSVRTYCNTHTCGLTGRRKRIRGASSAVVRDMLVDNFQGHPVPIVPKAVMTMVRNSMNADISYYKAWRGKELADNMMKGDPTQSFNKLSCYLHMVEQMNRGSITDIFVDEENRFKYMFLAFGACVRGYRSMRKVASIDGTWLKGKYNGVLLVASAQDGNYHQYPLAWGIVDVDCTSSWSWFLTKLLEVVPYEDELVIISDRHQGIISAVSTVYRNAHHGYCTWHLSQNMKTRCKKKGATEMFLHIAKIYKTFEFDIAYNDFRNRYPEAAQYLDERDSLDRWTRAYCPKTRYNIMTTNGVESINARLLEERKLPIIALLDSLQKLASSWFARYRHASIASNTNLTSTIEGILHSRLTDAQGMQVFKLGRMEFDVRSRGHSAIVDLESKRCTCRVFDIDRIPCAHAIAASGLANIDLYDMCSQYYSTMSWCMAYLETVYPVPEENEWPRNINFPLVLPPLLEKRVGRRKQNRFLSIGEFSKR